MNGGRLIRWAGSSFDPWQIQPVEHSLATHPLFALDSLTALAERLEARRLIRSHSGHAQAGTPFATAPDQHPNPRGAAETLRDLESAFAWTSLLNIQADPIYRELVDEVLDDVRPRIDARDPGLCYRAGWIFVTSPGAVTPYHMDHEHNFILQIRGSKRIYVWDPLDRTVVDERGVELFHARLSRERVTWSEQLRAKARVFDVQPGMGAYMPSTAPHMVENGPGPSVTASFTYYTDATRRRARVYRGTYHLRRLGLDPRPVGGSALRDNLLAAGMGLYEAAKLGAQRVLGRAVVRSTHRYAVPHRDPAYLQAT